MANTLTLLTHLLFTIVGMEEPTSKPAHQIWSLTKNAAAVAIPKKAMCYPSMSNFCDGKKENLCS